MDASPVWYVDLHLFYLAVLPISVRLRDLVVLDRFSLIELTISKRDGMWCYESLTGGLRG